MNDLINCITEIFENSELTNQQRNRLLRKLKYDENSLPFNDYTSILEIPYRIYYNIIERPVCPVCGKAVEFICKNGKLFRKYCSNECKYADTDMHKRSEEGCMKKYGVKNASSLNIVKQKRENTFLKKYGVRNNIGRKEVQETIRLKYGVDNISQSEEIKQKKIETCIKNNGTKYGIHTNTARLNRKSYESLQREYETKRANGTLGKQISKPEQELYEMVCEIFPNAIQQYMSREYPYKCDIYIPDINMYIEYNGFWTHGGHPFDSTSQLDKDILEKWRSHNNAFYNNAINVWSVSDVEKRNIAKANNLNYIELWDNTSIKPFIESLKQFI